MVNNPPIDPRVTRLIKLCDELLVELAKESVANESKSLIEPESKIEFVIDQMKCNFNLMYLIHFMDNWRESLQEIHQYNEFKINFLDELFTKIDLLEDIKEGMHHERS